MGELIHTVPKKFLGHLFFLDLDIIILAYLRR